MFYIVYGKYLYIVRWWRCSLVVWSRLQDCKEKPTPGGLYSPLPIAPMALLSYTSPTLMALLSCGLLVRMAFLLLFLWPHLENPPGRTFAPNFLRKRQMEINQNHDHEPDGQIGQAGCHPWHVLPCKAISAALCQQRQASDPLAYILGGHLGPM